MEVGRSQLENWARKIDVIFPQLILLVSLRKNFPPPRTSEPGILHQGEFRFLLAFSTHFYQTDIIEKWNDKDLTTTKKNGTYPTPEPVSLFSKSLIFSFNLL